MNNRQPNFNNDYQVKNSNNSGSGFDSNNSNMSNKCTGLINAREAKKNQSEEKHLDPAIADKIPKIENQPIKLKKIEGHDKAIENLNLEENKQNLKLKQPQKLNDSLVTKSSPSRGSAMTNPQGGRYGSSLNNSNTQDSAPLKPGKAIRIYKNVLTEFEKGEILRYREIYYVGEKAVTTKIKGTILEENNCGYDDDRGDYKVIINDHLGYRFEVLHRLGAGSFGQAYK